MIQQFHSGYLPEEMQSLPKTISVPHVYNSQDVETIQMSTDG